MTDRSSEAALADAPEPRLRAAIARWVSVAVFGTFLAYYGLLCFRHEGWGGDFQMYCAGISQLYRDFWHPLHEAMDVPGSQSTMYTVYLVFIAGVGKLFGATPYRVLEVAGIGNLFVLGAAALYLFSRHSLHRRWWLAAACFIFATLFLRWLHFGWSSEISLTNLQYIQPFPSTLAWSLAFLAFGLMEDLSRKGRVWDAVALSLVLAVSLLTHLITASWVVGIVGLHAIWAAATRRRWRVLYMPLGAIVMAFGLAAIWPYAPLFSQLSMSSVREPHDFGDPLKDMPNLYAVALPCYVYLILRLRRHAFWLLGLLATFGALLVWRQVGLSFGSRYSFFVGFFAHFAVAEVMALGVFALLGPLTELAAKRRWSRLDRAFVVAMLGLALVAWLPSPMRAKACNTKGQYGALSTPLALLRQESPLDEYYRGFSELRPYLSEADLVLIPVSRDVFDLASITGARVISAPNAHQVPDRGERQRDVSQFFDPMASDEEREDVVQRRQPTKVILPGSHFQVLDLLTRQYGQPRYRSAEYALWDLSSQND
jgi:hypothetical protein